LIERTALPQSAALRLMTMLNSNALLTGHGVITPLDEVTVERRTYFICELLLMLYLRGTRDGRARVSLLRTYLCSLGRWCAMCWGMFPPQNVKYPTNVLTEFVLLNVQLVLVNHMLIRFTEYSGGSTSVRAHGKKCFNSTVQ